MSEWNVFHSWAESELVRKGYTSKTKVGKKLKRNNNNKLHDGGKQRSSNSKQIGVIKNYN